MRCTNTHSEYIFVSHYCLDTWCCVQHDHLTCMWETLKGIIVYQSKVYEWKYVCQFHASARMRVCACVCGVCVRMIWWCVWYEENGKVPVANWPIYLYLLNVSAICIQNIMYNIDVPNVSAVAIFYFLFSKLFSISELMSVRIENNRMQMREMHIHINWMRIQTILSVKSVRQSDANRTLAREW